jgi:hypothetical protein
MQNATSSDQLTALKYEAQVFTPLKEVVKLNTLQFQGTTTIYSPSQEREVAIDPVALRKATMTFKMTDGLVGADKVISQEVLKASLQVIGTSPQIAGEYNLGPMFSYLMKTEHVNLTQFQKSREQIAYETAMNQWSQMAQLAIQKGAQFTLPQPVPQAYGYNPATSDPSKTVPEQSPTPSPQVNNGNA